MVDALYIDPQGPYPALLGGEHCWDETRDARAYDGSGPIVAHPPCGPWGRLRHLCTKQDRGLALIALEQVRKHGGVLEHPAGSKLWEEEDLPHWDPGILPDAYGGRTIQVDQVEWGHVARKRTWLYLVNVPDSAIDDPPFPGRQPTHHVSRYAARARRRGYTLKRTSTKQNKLTPPAFAEFLIKLAQAASSGR